MKKTLFLIFLFVVFVLGVSIAPLSKADDDCLSKAQSLCSQGASSQCTDALRICTDQTSQALQESLKATAPLQSKLDELNTQIKTIKDTVAGIEISLVTKENDINQGYKNLTQQQEILNATIRNYYMESYYNSPLIIFLSSSTASQFTQILGYQRANADRDKAFIINIAMTIQDLETKKKALADQETSLNATKVSLDDQSAQLDKIVSGAKSYQNTLSNQLASLNSIQQSILSQRLGALNIPLFATALGGCSSDINPFKDPGFSPAFGFFSYGVPNRVGLNQFGAFGRAKAGQSYQDILKAYYNFDSIDTRSVTINVDGYGSYSLEDYVKRIYEVPDSWGSQGGMEALKAQAIAARSYALAYTNNGSGSICTTQQCQVFQPDPKGGNWEQAVNATAGQVMIQGGNPIKAWFSSTHGGYIHSSGDVGWSDTSWTKNAVDASSSINSFSDLQSNAYDKDSPWFYCDWGSRSSNNGTAWLTPSEVADIVNVMLLAEKDSSLVNHLYQTDKSNPAGTDTWSADKVKSELGSSAYNSVSSISVSVDFNSGKTTNVTVSGDGKSNSFPGSDFKNYFDLRAPANIQIVGPLYNVEQR
jgi:SpoIID/LytB domain protein